VSARLGAASDDLISFVHSRAQGNPFFTEELLAALVEQGILSGDARQAVKSLGELELPRSVRSLIGERISRLPPRSHDLLPLARHFLLGGDTERGVEYAIRAGDDAAARYAHAEAAHHYRVALDLLPEPTADSARAAEVSHRLAGELYDLNKLPEALAAFEAAFVSYGRLNNPGGQALAQWGIARLHQ